MAAQGRFLGLTVWEAVVLGIVQGVTEFLPISSSGHLVIVQQWLGVHQGALSFDAIIHAGSLLAVITIFRGELLLMTKGIVSPQQDKEGRRLLVWLILATVPLVVVGLTLRDTVETAFTSIYVTVIMLTVTGGLLWLAESRHGKSQGESPTKRHALWMGLAQAGAVMPGLSRSGSTIALGMLAGLNRETAARYSFMMSIPALLGAMALELKSLLDGTEVGMGGTLEPIVLIAGVVASTITSYAAIAILLRFLRNGRLIFFAYYAWAFALLTLLLELNGS